MIDFNINPKEKEKLRAVIREPLTRRREESGLLRRNSREKVRA